MIFWRISRFKDLQGVGGLRAAGRWHYAGRPVVYLADSPSAALLETCVHTAANDIPPSFTLLKIVGPDLPVEEVALSKLDWQNSVETSSRIGSEWLHSGRSALLSVPSALVPETQNYLLNPLHPDATRLQVAQAMRYPFDLRLKS